MRTTSLAMSVRVCVCVDMVKEKLGKHRGATLLEVLEAHDFL